PVFAERLARLADVYVDDAFGAAHRAHASTAGMARFFRSKAAGFLLRREVDLLQHLLVAPAKPFVAVLGGAKVSDKIGVLENLLGRAHRALERAHGHLRGRRVQPGHDGDRARAGGLERYDGRRRRRLGGRARARRPAGRRDPRLDRRRGVARVPRGAPAARARRARGRGPGRARGGAPMSRTPLIAGNWKMHGARGEAVALAGALAKSVNRRLHACLAAGLIPIVCVGETLAEREAEATAAVIARQVGSALAGARSEQLAGCVIAYEPVWAIGTGRTATPGQAQEVHHA